MRGGGRSSLCLTTPTHCHVPIVVLSRISLFPCLPPSVVVHTYASGLHMQAELDGPTGTPFEGGLFRLRLVLPSDFPAAPPKVRMTSRGVGLSPQQPFS